MSSARLRTRLLSALGLPTAALSASCNVSEGTPPPEPRPNFAEPPPQRPGTSRREPWTVSYSLGPNAPTWCATGTARCFEPEGTCAPSIESTCSCGPGQWCGEKPTWPCTSPHEANVSAREHACCYELQRQCVPPNAGRALRDGGELVFAPTTLRADWLDQIDLELAPDPARAEHWLRVAAAEHASIASFARATLSLLALGAPPELLAATQRAAEDEIEHARVAFALAARHSRESRGPGPLRLPSEIETDRTAFAVATLHDACVEETRGTLALESEADVETDVRVRSLLRRIAADESRHVELAFRTLSWLLSSGADTVHGALMRELAQLRAQGDGAVREVVVPCLEALLGASPALDSSRSDRGSTRGLRD